MRLKLSNMSAEQSAWELVFRQEGRVYLEPAEAVIRFAGILREHGCQRVLDLGCGSGRHSVLLARLGFRVFGLDNAPTALRLSREWMQSEALSEAGFVLGDAHQGLPFREGAFDALLSTQVIHHARLASVQFAAQEIRRVLRPKGLLLVTVPVGKLPDETLDSTTIEIEPRTYLPTTGKEKGLPHHVFRPAELQALFEPLRVIQLGTLGEAVIALTAVRDA
jgi:SAM-dependent methyltransferase